MPIRVQSNVDYQGLCQELGVTMDELIHLVKNKDKLQSTSEDVLFTQVIGEFCEKLKKLESLKRRSSTTVETYLNFLDRVKSSIQKKDPELKVEQVNEDLVYDLLENSKPRKDSALATGTTNKYLAIIRSVLGFAFEQGYTREDLRYKFPIQTVTTLPRYLSDQQVEKVLQGAIQKTYGYRKRAIIIFLWGTGCRISELTNMRVKDFNINENLILIRDGKGGKERYIPMFDEIKIHILRYLKISGVPKWSSDLKGYLFCQDDGLVREKKVLNRSIQYLVRQLFDEIDLGREYTVHSFRHTFAVNCLKAGMREEYLMQILGHEDPKTTSVYTKLLPKDLKEEVMKYYPLPLEDVLKTLI